MENRRKFPRSAASFQVKYFSPDNENNSAYTIADNISRGGLCMPAVSSIARNGSVIRMKMNNHDGRGTVTASGKVRWAIDIKRSSPADEWVGVEFTEISPANIDRLTKTR